jgi:hypothetical protein
MSSRTTIVVAILVVMLILVAIEAVSGPFAGFRSPADDEDNGIGARCTAAGGHVAGHGSKATCTAPDGRLITLP